MLTVTTAPATFSTPSKSSFVASVGSLSVAIGQTAGITNFTASARVFKDDGTGNVGWYFTGKIQGTAGENLIIVVNGSPIELTWGKFGSGSWGWGLNGKDAVQMEVVTENGVTVPVSIRGNFTVVKSKGMHVPAGIPVNIQCGLTVEFPGSKKWAA